MADPANTFQAETPERDHRSRVLKGGTIITGLKDSEIGCMLRNQHENGAELKIPVEASIPDQFLLYVPLDRTSYRCEVRWRRNDRMGVKFIGREPKPKLHYG
ncbi:PilZ domain-containing protein [Mesorhizobium sp. ES1-1]|uniref:PilZ domain-containing protein n=1 Tax=Mesorhizobium sp. ES1-1 TaxID=2876629 RepID=UPI001CCD42E6|nr:PilZ domain-containing protein [Mesorhizobium sp. ES1-1]MBZ9676852.1 PilZ domain-containing protein [Mesorhizobium sp. ES1-1]